MQTELLFCTPIYCRREHVRKQIFFDCYWKRYTQRKSIDCENIVIGICVDDKWRLGSNGELRMKITFQLMPEPR